MTRRRQREGGFTLVETLVGLAILSGVLIATYGALAQGLQAARHVAERRAAVAAVEQQVEALRLQPLDRPVDRHGEAGRYRWMLAALPLQDAGRRSVIAFHVTGRIIPGAGHEHAETVFDTILLGPGR